MLDCLEENLTEPLTLQMLAAKLDYSPYYCTRQFHRYAGISLRDYIRLRKVSSAVKDLRDSRERIIDIAVKYGFSSHEAFTRSFKRTYGLTPAEYRRMPKLLPLFVKRNVFDPYYFGLGKTMSQEKTNKEITVNIQVVPAHKFIGIRRIDASGYWEFWKREEEQFGNDRCNAVNGVLESIKGFNGIFGGWFYRDGKRGYLYGVDVPADYAGEVPEGMGSLDIPEAMYAVFHHPPYNYSTMEPSVWESLNKSIESWNPVEHGYEWDDSLPTYQRHQPDKYGQVILRPVKKI